MLTFTLKWQKKSYDMDGIEVDKTYTTLCTQRNYKIIHSTNIDNLVYWFIAYEEDNPENLILSFRGTKNWKDALIDAYALVSHSQNSKYSFLAHKGMKDSLLGTYSDILQALENWTKDHKVNNLTVTGHSLGGGFSIIFYLLLHGESRILDDGTVTSNTAHILQNIAIIQVYTYGAPTIIGREEGVKNWEGLIEARESHIHNFVHNFDIVPRLLGNRLGANILGVFSGVIDKVNDEEELSAASALKQLSNSNFVQNISRYKPYGQFYFLTSDRKMKKM